MRSFIIAAAALFVLCFAVADAQYGPDTPTNFPEVFEWSSSEIGARVVFVAPELVWLPSDKNTELPVMAGAGEEFEAGGPRLPLFSRLVVAPAGKDLRIASIEVEWKDGGTHNIVHDPGSMPERALENPGLWIPAERDPKVYAEVADRSTRTAVIGETGRWRDLRMAQLTVRPLRYNSLTGQTDIATRVTVELEYVMTRLPDGYDPPGVSEALLPVYNAYVLGAGDELDEDEVERGAYLIICDSVIEDELDDLVEWRSKCGFNVIVATTDETGTTTSEIHDFIDDIYFDPDTPLDYVVLFGDCDDQLAIPTYTFPGNLFYNPLIPTDHKYTHDIAETNIAGIMPRYFIGRLSVDSITEANIIISKIIQYEKTPDDGNLDRFEKALVIAKWGMFAPGISLKQTKRWVREKHFEHGFEEVAEVYDPGGGTAQAISNAVNDGLSWINYRGYGAYDCWAGPYFYSTHVSQLINGNELPVITSMVCGTGNYYQTSNDPNFGETWIRHGTVNDPKGAVALVGPGELDTHTRWNNVIDGGWYRAMFDFGFRTLGQCFIGARLEMANMYPTKWNDNPGNGGAHSSVWFYWHTYNILGDPALQLRTEIPGDMTVDHPINIPENATYMSVSVTDTEGDPVGGARVVVTNEDFNIIGSEVTANNGMVDVIFDVPPENMLLDLTITRPDMMPYLDDLVVVPANGLQLMEFNLAEAPDAPENNDDGTVNPGEVVMVEATFEVAEEDGIDELSVTVSLPAGGGEVLTEPELFGNVESGQELTLTESSVRIFADWPNANPVEMLFSFNGTDFEQSHLVTFDGVNAPALSFAETIITGDFSPGGTAAIDIAILNSHPDINTGEVGGTLVSDSPYLIVTDPSGMWVEIPAGGGTFSVDDFEVQVDEESYPGREIPVVLHLITEAGYLTSLEFTLSVDGWDDVSSPTGPAGPGYYIFEDIDIGFGYETDYEYISLEDIGTDTGIRDEANNQDESNTFDLPFEFPYWDSTYEEITISSNGWFSFGETEHYFFRNWPIPSALSPYAGVAVFWEDLAHVNGRIYTHHDTDEGWFGIEWRDFTVTLSNGAPGRSTPLFFQARLLDPEIHGTPGGQGIIVLLYDDIQNNDSDDNYCTIGIISPDGTDGLQYEFNDVQAPTAQGVQDGLQMTIAIGQGAGVNMPDITFSPPLIQFNGQPDITFNSTMAVTNTGGLPLEYSIWAEGVWHWWELGETYPDQAGGKPNDNPGDRSGFGWAERPPDMAWGTELDESGLPDDYGYFYYDSDEGTGPAYDWTDIALEENEVELIEGEAPRVSDGIVLPFSFPLYGEFFDTLWICESGYLVMVNPEGVGVPNNTQLPRDYSPLAGIFPFWDHIGLEVEEATIYSKAYSDSFLVTWCGLNHLMWDFNDGPYTFQALLTADGAIHFRYHEMLPGFNSCTIGIQNSTGELGLQIKNNIDAVDYIHDSLSVRVVPPPLWFRLSGGGGRLAPGETQNLILDGQIGQVPVGQYMARLVAYIRTTDEVKTVPATLVVYEEEAGEAPMFDLIPGESVLPGELFQPFVLDPYVFDPDTPDEEITWTVFGHPEVTVEIDENRVAHPSSSAAWAGEATVTFRASDQEMNYSEQTVTFSTTGQNDAPRYDTVSPDFHEVPEPGTEVALSVEVSDPEGDEVTLQWYHGGELIGVGSEVVLTLNVTEIDSIYVVASDGQMDAVHTWWLLVEEEDDVKEQLNTEKPQAFALKDVYPNPFNSTLVVTYALPRTSDVDLRVYNVLGREVAHRMLQGIMPGTHRVWLDGKDWASGIYFLQWQAGGISQVRKAVLLK